VLQQFEQFVHSHAYQHHNNENKALIWPALIGTCGTGAKNCQSLNSAQDKTADNQSPIDVMMAAGRKTGASSKECARLPGTKNASDADRNRRSHFYLIERAARRLLARQFCACASDREA
jgi:hypothetical protein